jgi:hypothetical protein
MSEKENLKIFRVTLVGGYSEAVDASEIHVPMICAKIEELSKVRI